ncbi:pyruvate formate-lyase-activating protein [Corynebacterium sp. H127]|uniref:pyruvate formate-lyase-activating protein n=1 Tax=Corynebacterium sp. H127 TaxID=3133418 RepID=UPI00309E4207
MADGITGVVLLEPSVGEKVRGVAAGISGGELLETENRQELLAARRTGDVALIHSWELVTSVDGPGTRMTLFMSGCPLRCLYCHNPDTMEMKTGTLEPIEAVYKRIKRYKAVFSASGGGLTISGGEPLFQIAFTRRLLKMVHDAGIHTCIDTSGFLGTRLTDQDLENLDLVLLDVKSGNEETYQQVTGRQLQPTVDFGDRLSALGKRVWIRFVVVPGLTDSAENVQQVVDIVSRWKTNVERVEVLPFHNMGADKWRELDMHYSLTETSPPTAESMAEIRGKFRAAGFEVH